MSWLFSRVLVEEYLGESCSDGEPSVQSNGNLTQLAYLSQDKMTGFSRLSRFGMMFKPLTENRGEELCKLYREAFLVRTYQPQEKAQELMENDPGCGEKWRGSFTKYDQDSRSWKTHQCSLAGDLEPFLETWPQWGLMRDGECWEQRTLEQTIRGTEFGLLQEIWPTPRSCSAMAATITPESAWNEKRNPNLETIVGQRMWPTPVASDISSRNTKYKQGGTPLSLAVKIYPTPTCHNSKEGAFPSEYNRKTPSLATHAGGKLNPTWVEWLMGWPLEWTDLKPLETDKSHYVQQKHGES